MYFIAVCGQALEEHGEKQGTTEEFDIRQPLVDNFLVAAAMTAVKPHDGIPPDNGPGSPLTPSVGSELSPLSPQPTHPGANPKFPLGACSSRSV